MSAGQSVFRTIAAIALGIVATGSIAAEQITNLPLGQMNWKTSKEGVGFTALQGDRIKGAYMTVRLPVGPVSQ